MNKYILILFLAILSTDILFAEIKFMQIKVDERPDSSLFLPIRGYGMFDINDQTSNVLRVVKKRVDTYRVPFIKWKTHEVVLIGPFLDMCGDIQILDANNGLMATIKPNSFIRKGKREFLVDENNIRINEGYVHFRITSDILRKIKTQNFKIKTGPIDNLDMVECKLVYRYDIEHIFFVDSIKTTGDLAPIETTLNFPLPTKEIITHEDRRIVKNTFEVDKIYKVKMKIRGGINSSDKIRFSRGGNKDFFLERLFTTRCMPQFDVISSAVESKTSSLSISLKTIDRNWKKGEKIRSAEDGFMICMYDGNMGMPNCAMGKYGLYWGPYVYARLSNDVNSLALQLPKYTDFGSVKIGECRYRGWAPSPNPKTPDSPAPAISETTEPYSLRFDLLNFFTYKPSNNSQTPDYFSWDDLCTFGLNTNQNIDTIPAIKLRIYGSSEHFRGDLNVKFSRNNTVLLQRTITNIDALETKEIEYRRPENRVCVFRNNALSCKRCANNQNGIPHWDDEGITVEVSHNGIVIYTYRIQEDN